jgi:hypothetical protein
MTRQLLVCSILAIAVPGTAHATFPSDAEARLDAPTVQYRQVQPGMDSEAQTPMPAGPAQAWVGVTRAELEGAFWICDYAASTRGVTATPVELCGAVYEQLKNTRFGGDFLQLLVWWRENKLLEHQRLAAQDRSSRLEAVDRR